MKLALVLGKNHGEVISQHLSGIVDNLVISVYNDIAEFISTSVAMRSVYDRIVILSTLVDEGSLNDIHNFWKASVIDTEVVLLCAKGKDDELAKTFAGIFDTPLATAMLLEATTLQLIKESVQSPIKVLNKNYGVNISVDAKFEDGEPIDNKKKDKSDKKEKKGFFDRFGKKEKNVENEEELKDNKEQQNVNQSNNTYNQQMQSNVQSNQMHDQYRQMSMQNQQMPIQNQQMPIQNQQMQGQNRQGYIQNPQMNMQNQKLMMQRQQMMNQQMMMQRQQMPMQNNQMPLQNQQIQKQMQNSPMQVQIQGQQQFVQMQNTIPVDNDQVNNVNSNISDKTKSDDFFSNTNDEFIDDFDNSFDFDNDTEDVITPEKESNDTTEDIIITEEFITEEDNSINEQDTIDEEVVSSEESYTNELIETEENYDDADSEITDEQFIESPVVEENTELEEQIIGVSSIVDNYTNNNLVDQPKFNNIDEEGEDNSDEIATEEIVTQDDEVVNDDKFSNSIYQQENSFEEVNMNTNMNQNIPNVVQQDVNEIDLSNIDVANADSQYRQLNQNNQNVRVITKEVIRNVGLGASSLGTISNIYSGRLHKVLVVTGDRGSGVTSTAISIAKYMSNKVPVLYFDCDIDNHGLLNYLNYDIFSSYEGVRLEGVKRSRNRIAFENCVIAYDNNYDILTSDYSCDVKSDELLNTQSVVAEVLGNYGVIVVDCPVNNLHLISDLVLIGSNVICVEATKRGFMNTICRLEDSPLELRYKRSIVSNGTMLLTKFNPNTDISKTVQFVKNLVVADDIDWLRMPSAIFNGRLDDKFLNTLFEG